jgi:hypothetical protein
MKTFIHHDFPKLKQCNSPGVRTYTIDGQQDFRLPSVTSVVGLLTKDVIIEWRKRVGDEEANRISLRASKRGTKIHSLCESYLLNHPVEPDMFNKEMFNSLIPELDKIDNIHALEQRLFSSKLKVAGTVDCVAEYDGKLSVIDFKTSKRIKTKDEITSYFIQESAYAFMFYEMTDLLVEQLVTIVGVDDEPKPLVFIEKPSKWLKQFILVRKHFEESYGF